MVDMSYVNVWQPAAALASCAVLLLCWNWARHSTWLTRTVLRALRHGGAVPRHIAFIMDGNRRWARQSARAVHEGHERGGEKLTESLQWCLDAGVATVTVYAFSLENFKRPATEVSQIMRVCEQRFAEMLEGSDVIAQHRVRVRVLGDLSRLPPSLAALMRRVMARSAQHKSPTLNICFAYTGRFDIASGIVRAVDLCDSGALRPADVTEGTLAACLSSGFCGGADAEVCYPELLIRTSGETRISDFLLWEGCFSVLAFSNVLWPDLSAWDFVFMLLGYQQKERARVEAVDRYHKEECAEHVLEHGWSLNNCSRHVQEAMTAARDSQSKHVVNVPLCHS